MSRELLLGLCGGERWNDDLWVSAQKEVAKDLEIRVKAFDAPLHRESIDRDHHALILGQTCILRSDVLVDPGDDARRAHVATEDGFLCRSRVLASHDRGRPSPLERFIEHVCRAFVEHAAASRCLVELTLRYLLLEIFHNLFEFIASEVVNIWSGV